MLSNFASIFEIFFVFNVAYAGSQSFRETLDSRVLKLNEKIVDRFKDRYSSLEAKVVLITQDPSTQRLTLFRYRNRLAATSRYIRIMEPAYAKFPNCLKVNFLHGALLAFAMLLIGGVEDNYDIEDTSLIIILLNLFGVVFMILVFVRSLNRKKLKLRVRPFYALSTFVLPIILSFYYWDVNWGFSDWAETHSRMISVWAIIGVVFPFALHFFRAAIHRLKFRLIVGWQSIASLAKIHYYQYNLEFMQPDKDQNLLSSIKDFFSDIVKVLR